MVYDVASPKSFIYCQVLYSQIRRFHHQKLNRKTLLLIGNKTDQDYKSDPGKLLYNLSKQFRLFTYSDMIKSFSKKFSFWEEISCRDDQKSAFTKVLHSLVNLSGILLVHVY